jgi:hypothetical protein
MAENTCEVWDTLETVINIYTDISHDCCDSDPTLYDLTFSLRLSLASTRHSAIRIHSLANASFPCSVNLFYDVYQSIIIIHDKLPTKRDRSLRHIKRSEIPRPAIIISGHLSTSRTEFPTSSVAKARIWLVQDK